MGSELRNLERSITGEDLIAELDRLAAERGTYPAVLRCDRMNRVIQAVRSTVPESMWPEIRRHLEEDDDTAEPLEEGDWDGFEPDDDPFDADDSDQFD